jgi:hypothetical protein
MMSKNQKDILVKIGLRIQYRGIAYIVEDEIVRIKLSTDNSYKILRPEFLEKQGRLIQIKLTFPNGEFQKIEINENQHPSIEDSEQLADLLFGSAF